LAAAIVAKGGSIIQDESNYIVASNGRVPVGSVVMTSAGRIPGVKKVIHTVGPIWSGGTKNERNLLKSCITEILTCCENQLLSSVAIPAISSGIYGYPKPLCAEDIFTAIEQFAEKNALNEDDR
jgi:O-acetyl-ADP-ribose deacetylase (regulator of RNase III)